MTLSAEEQTVLKQFKVELQQALGDRFIEMRLFGSRARGEARPDSDMDVLVIVAGNDWPICDTVYDIATDILLQTDLCISPKVIGKSRFDQLLKEDTFFVRNISTDAITV